MMRTRNSQHRDVEAASGKHHATAGNSHESEQCKSPTIRSVTCREQGVNTEGLQLRLVDAKEQVVGRLATQLALLLQVGDDTAIMGSPCLS